MENEEVKGRIVQIDIEKEMKSAYPGQQRRFITDHRFLSTSQRQEHPAPIPELSGKI